MVPGNQKPEHVWLVMMKAMRALTRYAAAGIEETGLGLSDFGVLILMPVTLSASLASRPSIFPGLTLPGFSGESRRALLSLVGGLRNRRQHRVARSRRGFRAKYRFCRFYRFVFLVSYRVYGGASGSKPRPARYSDNSVKGGFSGDRRKIKGFLGSL